MDKYLFLSDLDLTLIDRDYNPTLPFEAVRAVSRGVSDKGHQIGLISDTAKATLEMRRRQFGFNGPLISERGALVSLPDGNSELSAEMAIDWLVFKQLVIQSLEARFPGVIILEEGYLKLKRTRNDRLVFLNDKTNLIIVNPYRSYSFSFHVNQFQNGEITQNSEFYKKIVDVLNDIVIEEYQPFVYQDANPDYGVVIYTEKQLDKSLAIPIIRKYYPEHTLVAIGDSQGDAVLKGHVDILAAVGNASPEMKKRADIITSGEITHGMLEILEIFVPQVREIRAKF